MVPAAHLEDGFKLGGWVGKQRDKKVKLPPDVIQRLDALGFIWDVRERAWEDGFWVTRTCLRHCATHTCRTMRCKKPPEKLLIGWPVRLIEARIKSDVFDAR